jgi:hypothetical protein
MYKARSLVARTMLRPVATIGVFFYGLLIAFIRADRGWLRFICLVARMILRTGMPYRFSTKAPFSL